MPSPSRRRLTPHWRRDAALPGAMIMPGPLRRCTRRERFLALVPEISIGTTIVVNRQEGQR